MLFGFQVCKVGSLEGDLQRGFIDRQNKIMPYCMKWKKLFPQKPKLNLIIFQSATVVSRDSILIINGYHSESPVWPCSLGLWAR